MKIPVPCGDEECSGNTVKEKTMQGTGEILYNGICLPEVWPPQNMKEPLIRREYFVPPYLIHPPEVILLGTGRELFVDDFLVEKTDCDRSWHYPEKYENNPVLKPEYPWEVNNHNGSSCACPKSGGVWFDYEKKIYRMWYEGGWLNTVCCAESTDGLHWERPQYDVFPGTNRVLPFGLKCDSWTVVHDYYTENEKERYKLFLMEPCGIARGMCMTSPDGIHWSNPVTTGMAGDRSTMFFNPFRKKWCFSLRAYFDGKRIRNYVEGDDFITTSRWGTEYPDDPESLAVFWAGADRYDPVHPATNIEPQLYNLDAVPYESIMLGFFQLHYGPPNDVCEKSGLPKITELEFAYSRDGFHWARPDRNCALRCGDRTAWDRGYMQSLGNICIVDEEKLTFYFTGFYGDDVCKSRHSMYNKGATGIAFLRRDGFVSLDAREERREILTRKVRFDSSRLFVNVDSEKGSLLVEVLDEHGNVFEGFSRNDCLPVTENSTKKAVRWKKQDSLAVFAGRIVRFRFVLENAKLYSFWISPGEGGESCGYVAGGGACYHGPVDD